MSLTINNKFMDGVSSGDKTQHLAAAGTVKPTTRVLVCTGSDYTVTLPPAAEVEGVFLAIVNAAGTITCAEPTNGKGMIALASTSITTSTVALLYSSGVAWHAVSGLS